MSNFFHFHLYFALIMLQCSAKILLLAACTVILLHRYSVTKCVLPEICSLFMPYMVQRISGGFRGGALGASAPPAESMVKKS